MKIVIASDSFKGSLGSSEVAAAVEFGIRFTVPDADIVKMPVADGGEGTADVIGQACAGQPIEFRTFSPCGKEVSSRYWIIEGATAVIDVASSCGLVFVAMERDVMNYSTYGFGLQIVDAYERGCRRFIIGLGGSATCDGGLGMLAALGLHPVPSVRSWAPVALDMKDVKTFATRLSRKDILDCEFIVLTDVINPLYGPQGAAEIFGPQKGATRDQIRILDQGLRNLAGLGKEMTGRDMGSMPGAGAAGGLGWAFMTFLNAETVSGVEAVLDIVGFDEASRDADLVITGEGRMDGQTLAGKLPFGVCRRARNFGVPTVALAGSVSDTLALLNAGFAGVFPIVRSPMTLIEAMDKERTFGSLRDTAASIMKLLSLTNSKFKNQYTK